MESKMYRRTFLKLTGVGAAAAMWPRELRGAAGAASQPNRPPNIVLVLTDDQGYGDLGCHGNPIVRTPNLDKMRGLSIRFNDFHVSPTCAPTRCALLSGRHEFKSGVTHTIHERERMSLKATTFPQLLKSVGYATGIFGKWHLGDEEAYQPGKRGFDEVFIHGGGGIGQTYPGSCGDAPGNTYFDPFVLHNGKFEKTQGFCTDVFFAQAMKWMEQVKGKQPFFAYIPTNAPHAPYVCPKQYEQMYTGKAPGEAAAFFGMITNIDDNVGTLLARLKEWQIEKDTLVVFMTDNGTAIGRNVYNADMRGAKGSPHNGGTRVPAFFYWPGTLEPADRDHLTAHVDILPTMAEVAGAKLPADLAGKLDGRSLVPLLSDASADWPQRCLFTHVGRWQAGKARESKYAGCSVRRGDYLLVCDGKKAGAWQLYDIRNDPGQKTDLSGRNPELLRELSQAYDKWWEQVLPCMENEDVVGPKVNPYKELFWKQFGGSGGK